MKKTLIKSDVAGIVAEICFNKRDFVKEGENLIFIESMKMEIPVIAPFDGELEEIFVKKDEVISQNQPLLTLKS
jgi:biotin carboxyl carrier protein